MGTYDNALLDLPKRMTRRLSLPDHAAALVSLPLSSGGLSYRPRKSHADCAFLVSYMHTAHHFPKLLPALAHRVPPILDLVPATGMPPPPPPPFPQAALAARAFVRVTASAPLVRDRVTGWAPVLRHAQHALSAIVTEAETQRAVSLIYALDRPSLPRHMELYHSNCGDAVILAMVPSDPATTLSNKIFETGMKRRLLIELTPVTPSERRN